MSDLTPPRWGTPRNPDRPNRLDEAEAMAAAFGVELFAWQRHMFAVATELRDDGNPVYRTVGNIVGRQNGKTLAAAIRIGMELAIPGRQVALTAQDRNMAFLHWEEHVSWLEEALPIKRVIRGAGREHIELANGSKYGIFTPSGKGARGKTLDLVCVDEALTHDMALLGAVEPTMATKPHAQLWITSNAGDESSTLLRHYRDLGHELVDNPGGDNAARLAWFEWAPSAERIDPQDRAVWHEAIPTLAEDQGVTEEAVEQAANTYPPDVFAREYLNVWTSTRATAAIDPARWEACRTDLALPPAGFVFGLDVSPQREHAAIVAAGPARGGRVVVEVIDARDGVGWVLGRLVDLTRRHRAPVVIVGATSAAGSFVPLLEADDVRVINARTSDYAAACGLFHDATEAETVGHPGDPRLDDAVAIAGRKPQGDSWVWKRHPQADLTPLVAASLAHWGAVTVHAPTPAVH